MLPNKTPVTQTHPVTVMFLSLFFLGGIEDYCYNLETLKL